MHNMLSLNKNSFSKDISDYSQDNQKNQKLKQKLMILSVNKMMILILVILS